MTGVVKSGWAWVALDHTGSEAERARALGLACGHEVYRRVCWTSRRDPLKQPAPKRVVCELCAGKPPKFQLADEVKRRFLAALTESLA